MQHVAIRLAQRVRQHAVAHEAAVHEDVLRRRPAPRTRAAPRSRRGARRRLPRPRAPRARRSRRPAAARRARCRPAGRQAVHDAAVVLQREARPPGCASATRRNASSQCAPLGRLGAQELAPRRRVEEELLDRDRRARRRARRARPAPRCRPRPRCATRAACPPRATRAPGATPTRSTPAPRRESPSDAIASRSIADCDLRRRVPRDRERQVLALDAARRCRRRGCA